MREIKFRGKRIDNGEWVYGYYYFKHEITESGIVNQAIIAFTNKHNQFIKCQVDPESVGQYTGLKDKNVTEICEGDLLKHNKNIYKVRYSGNQHVLLLKCINNGGMNWRDLEWCNKVAKYIEVIGNVAENPELMEA